MQHDRPNSLASMQCNMLDQSRDYGMTILILCDEYVHFIREMLHSLWDTRIGPERPRDDP